MIITQHYSVFCISCNNKTIRWGKDAAGHIRYRCLHCNKTCTSRQRTTGKSRPFLWYFEQYVLYGVSYVVLSKWSGYSIQHLHTQFERILSTLPPDLPIPQEKTTETYLIIDGRWFGKCVCLMIYRQSKSKLILYASFMKREYGSLILKNLKVLHEKGYRFTGIVSDGGTGIRNAVVRMFGHIPHQICMAHIHRQATNGLGQYPKDVRVRELQQIANHMWLVESKEAREWWKKQITTWIRAHGIFAGETRHDVDGRWWYIHGGVRKCIRCLQTAYEDCFTFLDHPLMPKTSNEIEATIGNLSMKHVIHRGLKRENLQPFIRWFIYFYNKNLLSQRKSERDKTTNTFV